ncbi:MAG: hypothetical protein EZS28_051813 [Streblomastix strix]|uniref:Uncharacterized protein n=1 Tax=Streblomastix strix TaxID=222440 RepID=A0A5J4T411_9EUKA|nr:MAG: hypothetical protein EZS28_051813 [Streblomastix strix]
MCYLITSQRQKLQASKDITGNYQRMNIKQSMNFTDEALLTIGFAAFSDNPSYKSKAPVNYMNKQGDRVNLFGYHRIQGLA